MYIKGQEIVCEIHKMCDQTWDSYRSYTLREGPLLLFILKRQQWFYDSSL